MTKNNIFNIPANYHFFNNLLKFIEENFALNNKSTDFEKIKIFLPNRRSCREFKKIITNKYSNIFLPQIKAISDLSYEDFENFKSSQIAKKTIEELLEIKNINKLDYLFFLSNEISKLDYFNNNYDFLENFKIANNIYALFEDIELQGSSLENLEQIDDSNLSQHRLKTLEFLKTLNVKVKKSLLEKDVLFGAFKHNFIVEKFTNLLEIEESKNPIIIAGSTGSVLSGRKLIKSLAKNNFVILHGLNNFISNQENHPQYFLNQLLNFLEVKHAQINNLTFDKISNNCRQEFLSLLMLPDKEISLWQDVKTLLDINEIKKDLEQNFSLIEAQNELKEAQIIKLICLENSKNNKKIAIISNNESLLNFVKLELNNSNLYFNDTRNIGAFSSNLVNFILIILENIENNFDSHSLVQLLKHNLFFIDDEKIISEFEINILRQEREEFGLNGIIKKISKLEKNQNILEFFNKFIENFSEILKVKNHHDLSELSVKIIKICQNLSNKNWSQLLEEDEIGNEIFELFRNLETHKNIKINNNRIIATFKALFSQISYFIKSNDDASIQILSTIEARLLNFDIAIIASLNENDFPQIISSDWLGKKIKKDLNIERTLKKIGQSAYDFCNYLSNEKVFLTRHKLKNNQIAIESPFLLKFKTLAKKIGANINSNKNYEEILLNINNIESFVNFAPNPKLPNNYKFDSISITEIDKLIKNPYHIYAKKLLKLKELNKIDYESSFAEFGSFIHEALENYILNNNNNIFSEDDFLKLEKKTFDKYFINEDVKIIWWSKFENIISDFIEKNKIYEDCNNIVELKVEHQILNTKIIGKIDRIIINKNKEVEILDYKTGQVPSKISVISGQNLQLLIYALLFSEIQDFKGSNLEICTLTYWKLSSFSESKISKIIDNKEDMLKFTQLAKKFLHEIFDYFFIKNNGFLATQDDEKSEYKHLIRKEEWNY